MKTSYGAHTFRRLLGFAFAGIVLAAPAFPQEQKKEEPKTAEAKPAEAKPEAAKPEESPAPAVERAVQGSIEVGARWVSDVGGNFNAYRSIVNLGEGVRLTEIDLKVTDPTGKLFDNMFISGGSWGGDPYNTAKVTAEKQRVYRLNFDYRNIAYFNYLPSFANPSLDRGLLINQRSFDTLRRNTNVELEIMPGRRVTPYFGYLRNSGTGSGITPFVSDGNEFPVATRLRDHTDNYFGGVRLDFTMGHVTLEQGGTKFKDDQTVSWGERNYGNRLTSLFGQSLFLDSVNQAYGVRGDSLYSKAIVTLAPVAWANFYGQFLYSRPQIDMTYSQANRGNFVLLNTLRFFNGQQDVLTGLANMPHRGGNAGVELRIGKRIRVFENYMTDRFTNASSALLAESLFFTATATTPGQSSQLASADRLQYNYSRHQTDVLVDVTQRITLRGGYRYVWGDAQVRAPQLLDGARLETGDLKQHVGLFGGSYRTGGKFSANADFEVANSDRVYFRTSLKDYQQFRGRARYQMLGSLALLANVSVLNNENQTRGVDFKLLSRNATLAAHLTPGGGKKFGLLAEYSRVTFRSDTLYLSPSVLRQERSLYRDNGHVVTALIDCNPSAKAPVKFSFGGSMFLSSGSRPTDYYQPTLRVRVPIGKYAELFSDWRYFGYSETFYNYEGFRSHQILTGLRLFM